MEDELEGFGAPDDPEQDLNTRQMIQEQNRKKKKSGGFQAMGLSHGVFKGIQKKGYKIPTPIQRKAIPVILEGKDVVAMARTGSGKTACFLIPLFERLKTRVAQSGARALILSPTRELALQTLRFFKDLSKFTGLKAAVILGGDLMDQQFTAIHENPDVIIATPGRFLHVCVEMDLRLQAMEYVVFDEADRLFELGFGEQLQDILKRLPDSHQTLLFSATLPKLLVDFAKAGLHDPVLIRLDVDTKIPEQLQLCFFWCRPGDKLSILLYLLRHIIRSRQQSVIFTATRHHVEYIHMLLELAGIRSTYIYSGLDPAARKIHAAKFQTGKVGVLVVTDVAARGIDIPLLDNVINFNFPAKPKLFVHRVGRCARAGRSGVAYSIICPEEAPYFLDLHLFLGRSLSLASNSSVEDGTASEWDGILGNVPQSVVDEEHSQILQWHETSNDLGNLQRVSENAFKHYVKCRPPASSESAKRVKDMLWDDIGIHPLFLQQQGGQTEVIQQLKFLESVRKYKPQNTIFEIGPTAGSALISVMKAKRKKHEGVIAKFHQKMQEKEEHNSESTSVTHLEESTNDELVNTFQDIIAPKRRATSAVFPSVEAKRKKMKKAKQQPESYKDKEHYINYVSPDFHSESGLAVNGFQQQAQGAILDLTADDGDTLKRQQKLMHWDKKKKKMVSVGKDVKVKKIRTEAGVWIPATYKTNRYEQWRERSKIEQQQESESDDEEDGDNRRKRGFANKRGKPGSMSFRGRGRRGSGKPQSELRRPEQILKARKQKERSEQRKQKGRGGRGGSRSRGGFRGRLNTRGKSR